MKFVYCAIVLLTRNFTVHVAYIVKLLCLPHGAHPTTISAICIGLHSSVFYRFSVDVTPSLLLYHSRLVKASFIFNVILFQLSGINNTA